jgi:hypothetical protein
MSDLHGASDRAEGVATIRAALDAGAARRRAGCDRDGAAKVRAIRDFGADQNAAIRQIVWSQLSACYLRLIGKDSAFLISPWKP